MSLNARSDGPGLCLAVLSAFFNGSFSLLFKFSGSNEVHPLVFNFYTTQTAALAGLLALVAEPRVFSPWGVLSGLLFVASSACSFIAIRYLGLSMANGLWCGVAVLASFWWDVAIQQDAITNGSLAAAGLLLLLAGIAGVATAGERGKCKPPGASYEELSASSLLPVEAQAQLLVEAPGRLAAGCAAGVASGVLGGLMLAPMLAAPLHARGIPYLPSMSLGVWAAAPLSLLVLSVAGSSTRELVRSAGVLAAPGAASGLLWQAGNICSILAVEDPALGMEVAYPIRQTGLFVAGMWGILLFGEVQGRCWQALYWASGIVLLMGAALLAASK